MTDHLLDVEGLTVTFGTRTGTAEVVNGLVEQAKTKIFFVEYQNI